MHVCKMVRFGAFLRIVTVFLCVFSCRNGLQKSPNLHRIVQKRFYAIPPVVMPHSAVHRHATILSLFDHLLAYPERPGQDPYS